MKVIRALYVWILLLSLAIAPATVTAQGVSTPAQAGIAGPWHGRWTAPEGWIYEAVMSLRVSGSGSVAGEINWTLRQSPRPIDQAKLGMTGVELVRGTYFPVSGTLILEGYEKKDPNTILGLDKYRLVISDDNKTMGGITRHHKNWNAQFFLAK